MPETITQTLGIGSTVYRFDINRRTYAPKAPGSLGGGPIWREHWEPLQITGETSRSWIVGHPVRGFKLPKSGTVQNRDWWALSEQELDDRVYINDNRHKIAERIQRWDGSADRLRLIAGLVGYEGEG